MIWMSTVVSMRQNNFRRRSQQKIHDSFGQGGKLIREFKCGVVEIDDLLFWDLSYGKGPNAFFSPSFGIISAASETSAIPDVQLARRAVRDVYNSDLFELIDEKASGNNLIAGMRDDN